MKQRAIQAGVVHSPAYRFVEAGQEFEHPELLKWAIPIGSIEPGAEPVIVDDLAPTEPVAAPRRRAKAAQPEPDQSVDDVI